MSLSVRLLSLLLAPMLLLLGTYGLVAHELRRTRYLERANAEVADLGVLTRVVIGSSAEAREPARMTALLEQLSMARHVLGVAVFDGGGRLVAVSRAISPDEPAMAALARKAFASGHDESMHTTNNASPVLLRATHLDGPGGVAVVGRDLAYIDADVAEADRVLAAAMLTLLFATAFPAVMLLRRTILQPTKALVAGVERVSAGELEGRVPEGGAAELARLARAFNHMTASLRQARQEAQSAAQARAAMERRVQHSQALSAAGQVAASFAHEIGSPLNIILGRARLSSEDSSCPEPVRQDLQTIAEQCERISRVVRQLLEVARAPAVAPGPEESLVGEVAGRVLDFVSAESRSRHVSLSLEAPEAKVRVALHPDRLFQVLFNLCMNAMQAQPEGGSVRVRIGEGNSPLSGERCAVVEVEDDGPGVPPELLGKVAHPFFTTKAPGEGSGLGLAIVEGIAREAGGRLEVENLPERGARFRVMLPFPPPPSAPSATSS